MWSCHKCGKPVYFAERKQSLGYDWHPECLRCEECGKRLNPGLHAEHKGVPYCHVPCYGALFGPQLFGHGTRVESHSSFGKVENKKNLPRSHLESKLKVFNQYCDGKSGEIKSRYVNGRMVLEGTLRICWGVMNMIHLKEDDDQRVTVQKKKNKKKSFNKAFRRAHSSGNNGLWDEIDDPLAVETIERFEDKLSLTAIESSSNAPETSEQEDLMSTSFIAPLPADSAEEQNDWQDEGEVVANGSRPSSGSTAIRRRSGQRRSRTKIKRRCSINGHFYNRETSFFLPPRGSQMSVWVSSLVNTFEVINLILEKYRVDSNPHNFALFVVHDNGEQKRLRDDDYPLVCRVMLGPHEDVAKLFLMDASSTQEISNEVAQFLNFSTAECNAILERYNQEEDNEMKKIKAKYREMKKRLKRRMEELKVRL
ncbi:ras association domain-containing protein 4 [Neocloeon triangulifer]|uniref:ras association domain-containing protein 4 n=1 Tax=Neocloeon triangulifer TaxID=2078957 RepID=UPI00286F1113|nr:ras association domain-containing protein 4 [Neocloeon triangulifer]